jgi:hypothetical protein
LGDLAIFISGQPVRSGPVPFPALRLESEGHGEKIDQRRRRWHFRQSGLEFVVICDCSIEW